MTHGGLMQLRDSRNQSYSLWQCRYVELVICRSAMEARLPSKDLKPKVGMKWHKHFPSSLRVVTFHPHYLTSCGNVADG